MGHPVSLRIRKWGLDSETLYMIVPTHFVIRRSGAANREEGWVIQPTGWGQARVRGLDAREDAVWKKRNSSLFSRCYPTRREALQHMEAVLAVDPLPEGAEILDPVKLYRHHDGTYRPATADVEHRGLGVRRHGDRWEIFATDGTPTTGLCTRTLLEAAIWLRYVKLSRVIKI